MKKIFLIMALGFFLVGCQNKPHVLTNTKLKSDYIIRGHYEGLRHHVFYYNRGNIVGNSLLGVSASSPIRLSYGGSNIGFEEVNAKAEERCWMMNKEKKGNLTSNGSEACFMFRYFQTNSSDSESSIYLMVKNDVDELQKLVNNTSSNTSSSTSSKIGLTSMIDEAKKICKTLDFKEGTEKFSDCSLKIYTQSLDLAAEKNQRVIMQGQSLGSNTVTIYDPVRDRDKALRRAQGLINGKCTLADLSKC